MIKSIGLMCLCVLATPCSAGQQFDLPRAVVGNRTALATAMPGLASSLIGAYRDSNRSAYLDNLFRLQLVAGRDADAIRTLNELREVRAGGSAAQKRAIYAQYEMFARAETAHGTSFGAALAREFHEIVDPMDDRTSALVVRTLNVQNTGGLSLIVDESALEDTLNRDLAKQKSSDRVSLADALQLMRDYQIVQTYHSIAPFAAALVAEDDRRRYVVDQNVLVSTPDGASVCAFIVRPRKASGPLPTLVEFTIYADISTSLSEARRDASNGYASVKGFSRGKLCSPGQAVPIEHDGADAAALIEWIARQPWSDGRVGMYGASYDGFTAWAAANHRPQPLKALMTAVNLAPGIDVPMEGSIAQTFSYYWPFYVTDNKTLNGHAFEDRARWNRLYHKWYISGRPYRDLDKIDGTPNPIWDRWMDHPSYDSYWQKAIPFRQEFAQIDIPTLITTGYYDGGEIGALYYFTEHAKYRPHADDYLVVGPYDHHSGNRGTVDVLGDDDGMLNGYRLDSVAHEDFGELRYQWFDYVFRHGAKPVILKDKINYEVMGANVWKHAPSLPAMAGTRSAFYLGTERAGKALHLDTEKPRTEASAALTVNLSDRSDVDRVAPGGDIVDTALDTWNLLEYVSDPLQMPNDVSGLFTGHLDFIASKKDFDFVVQLYELTPRGEYVELSWYMARASFVADRTHRQLLSPGIRQTLDFTNGRLTSRQFQRGSRLVIVLGVIKQPEAQINYGSGKNVSDETIADAGAPLKIEWFNDSFIGVPMHGGSH
jgi:putative CocE/NonD family hydrolase